MGGPFERDWKQGTPEQRPDKSAYGFYPNPQPKSQDLIGDAIKAFMEFLNGIGAPGPAEEPEREMTPPPDFSNKPRRQPFVAKEPWKPPAGTFGGKFD